MTLASVDKIGQWLLDSMDEHPPGEPHFRTGISSLDATKGWFWAGDVALVQVPTACESTLIAQAIARHVAGDLSRAVVVLSLRMSSRPFIAALVHAVCAEPQRSTDQRAKQQAAALDFIARLRDWPLFVHEGGQFTAESFAAELKTAGVRQRARLEMLVVDGADCPSSPDAALLTALATELQVPILALAAASNRLPGGLSTVDRLAMELPWVASLREQEIEVGAVLVRQLDVIRHPRLAPGHVLIAPAELRP